MKLVYLTRSLNALLPFITLSITLVGCHSLPELIQPSPVTIKSNTNARTASAAGTCDYDYSKAYEDQLIKSGWTKKFEDEFNISPSAPANTRWNVWVGGAFNNELQMYTNSPENLTITEDTEDQLNPSDHVLLITALRQDTVGSKYRTDVDATPTSFSYTSARIETKQTFTPTRTMGQVRMVARIKMPKGYGMWPAFWSYGSNWPTNGEIDIFEARGHMHNNFETNYHYGRTENQDLVQNASTYFTTESSLMDCWHVYEVIWTKDALTFMLDGVVVAQNTGGYVPSMFGKQQWMVLNQAVGGNFFYENNTLPGVDQIESAYQTGDRIMQVDWVKVFVKR